VHCFHLRCCFLASLFNLNPIHGNDQGLNITVAAEHPDCDGEISWLRRAVRMAGDGFPTWICKCNFTTASQPHQIATIGLNTSSAPAYSIFNMKYPLIASMVLFEICYAVCGAAPAMNALILSGVILVLEDQQCTLSMLIRLPSVSTDTAS
jgi:hypothetical protein